MKALWGKAKRRMAGVGAAVEGETESVRVTAARRHDVTAMAVGVTWVMGD
ncbi:hypothetical protein QS306_16365 [Paraburkholderia bonniea]|nr:hypothetical protein [Paraburkholderia bonniea]WJF91648.1 hypothetical protein QS306_16365 [Paraburkholderia bonniea]